MDNPLTSVIVTTYNSAEFILETLESVKAQTYQNIELIVSDDASVDNTLSLARKWISENTDRFVRTDVITVPHNTGVSANCNRCIAASRADWIKFIAGDDILLPNCIEDNMRFVERYTEARVLFSYVRMYRNRFTEENFLKTVPGTYPMNIMNPNFTAADQFKLLLLSDRVNFTPSYFFRKDAVLSVDGYDEANRVVEDYPMWLKLTHAGHRLYFMEQSTVGYRQHDRASNNKISLSLYNPLLLKLYGFRKQFVHPYLPWDLVGAEKVTMNITLLFEKMGWNRSTSFLQGLYKFFTVYINPFRYLIFLKKRMGVNSVFYRN